MQARILYQIVWLEAPLRLWFGQKTLSVAKQETKNKKNSVALRARICHIIIIRRQWTTRFKSLSEQASVIALFSISLLSQIEHQVGFCIGVTSGCKPFSLVSEALKSCSQFSLVIGAFEVGHPTVPRTISGVFVRRKYQQRNTIIVACDAKIWWCCVAGDREIKPLS